MTVDREARDQLAELLRHFVAKQMTNLEFDNAAFDIKTHDAGVKAIRDQAWMLYDDLRKHKLTGEWAIEDENRREVARWILFLKSDYEYRWPVMRWWQKLLFPVVTLLTLGAGTYLWRQRYARQGNREVWPFLCLEEFKMANKAGGYVGKGY